MSQWVRLFDDNPQPMWLIDPATHAVVHANAAALAQAGYGADDIARVTLAELLEARTCVPPTAVDAGRWDGEWRCRRSDGSAVDIRVRARAVEFGGRPVMLLVTEDMTAFRSAAEALRQSEQEYRTVVDSIRQVIFRADARGRFTFLNAAWTDLTGFAVMDTLGTPFLGYVHPDDRARHAEVFQPVAAEGSELVGLEARYVTRTGGVRWVEVFAQLVLDAGGAVTGIFGTLTDITERKRAAEELLGTRARLEHLLVSSPTVIFSAEPTAEQPLTFVSGNVTSALGFRPAEMLVDAGFWESHVHPDDRDRVAAALVQLAADGRHAFEYRFLHQDGAYRWLHDERGLVRTGDDAIEVVGSWSDVTAAREREQERSRLATVVEQAAEGIVIMTRTGVIDYVNPGCERATGYAAPELLGRTLRMTLPADDGGFYERVRAALAAGDRWSGSFEGRRKDGGPFHADGSISPVLDESGRLVAYVAVVRDVTREHEIQAQLQHAQKMEVAGRLAGGVAHDFNNVLTIITGRTQILLRRMPADDPRRRDVALIQEAALRAAGLTRQLLLFSRKQAVVPRVVALETVVGDMEKMLHRLIGEDIELALVTEPGTGRVKADPGQLEQVLMNLVVNARDAMPGGGRITITVSNVDVDAALTRRHVGLRPGPYVVVEVRDTGCGMDAETQRLIFEPFFTTKAPDKGTGLGLSIVYSIVKHTEGEVIVESAPGRGTAFRIFLPRVDATADEAGGAAHGGRGPRGSETVLIAEDEDEVRALAREVLAERGYAVLEARHGMDALTVAAAHTGPIHLLLTDVVMPQLGGRELATRLTGARPATRVLFMSGYTDDEVVRAAADEASGLNFLPKPFTPAALARKVRETLEPAAIHP